MCGASYNKLLVICSKQFELRYNECTLWRLHKRVAHRAHELPRLLYNQSGGEGLEVKNMKHPEKSCITFLITHLFSYLCAGNFGTIVLLILRVFKQYVECLYRHQHKVTKKKTAPLPPPPPLPKAPTDITHTCIDNKTPKLVCDFPKPLAVICVNHIH